VRAPTGKKGVICSGSFALYLPRQTKSLRSLQQGRSPTFWQPFSDLGHNTKSARQGARLVARGKAAFLSRAFPLFIRRLLFSLLLWSPKRIQKLGGLF
jgi:hypothetical protein